MIERGIDGAIINFMEDISEAARNSNGFVLELGVSAGTGSTLAIQEGLAGHPDPLHISVDHRDYMSIKPDVPWWHLVIGDSRELKTMGDVIGFSPSRRPGLIFIDTDHTYEQMKAELIVWSAVASDQTVWLFHDTHMFGVRNDDMILAITGFARRNNWTFEDWRTEPHGLGRMKK